jgi:ribonuclease VapC
MKSKVVLDASAIMAAVLEEDGGDAVHDIDADRIISSVNLAEARSRLFDRGISAELMTVAISVLDAVVVPFSESDAIEVADMRAYTKSAGLSIGDRACLVLAKRLNAKAMTADKIWGELKLPVQVELIR